MHCAVYNTLLCILTMNMWARYPFLIMKIGRILNNVAQNQYKPRRHKLYTQNPAFVPFWPSETVVLQTFLIFNNLPVSYISTSHIWYLSNRLIEKANNICKVLRIDPGTKKLLNKINCCHCCDCYHYRSNSLFLLRFICELFQFILTFQKFTTVGPWVRK